MKKTLLKTDQNNPDIRAYKEAVERGKKDHHVVYKDNSWMIIRSGVDKALSTYDTQQEAIVQANYLAKNSGTSVYVHSEDGRIRETKSYGDNSFLPQN